MGPASGVIVLRYHEIVLRRGNRPYFVRMLADRVRAALDGLPVGPVGRASARLVVPLHDLTRWPEVRARLERVFGIAKLALAEEMPLEGEPRDAVARLAERVVARVASMEVRCFRIVTKRSDKQFPLTSPEVNAIIGARVQEATGAAVDLRHAPVSISIDLVTDRAFVALEQLPGAGGLPVGTSGRVLALLSGGIDSPVAAWRMMGRGCRVDFVHFHSAPFHDRTSQEKARTLARLLAGWQGAATLRLVPFGEVQRQIVAAVQRPLRVVLYRRMMLRIAEALARDTRAEALVTGDSLGQVSSQTLTNIAVIGEAIRLPVLRPLVGMDKGEIMATAERIGTFETSIIPDQDCCQLFVPRHPTTAAHLDAVREAEARLDLPGLVAFAVAATEMERVDGPGVRPPATDVAMSPLA